MKTWKTITLTALTTSALCLGGFATYEYIQPQPYQGEVFNNDKTIKHNTSSDTSSTYVEETEKEKSITNYRDYDTNNLFLWGNDNTIIFEGKEYTVFEIYNGYYICATIANNGGNGYAAFNISTSYPLDGGICSSYDEIKKAIDIYQ